MHKVLAILPAVIPSNVIGIITPLSYLQAQGLVSFETSLESTVRPRQILDADVIVTGRNLDPFYQPVYQFALDYGVPIISELDDNLLEPAAYLNAFYHEPERINHLNWLLSKSNLVRVYARYLEQMLRAQNVPVDRVTAALDWSAVVPELPDVQLEPLSVVYQTSRTDEDRLFKLIEEDLHTLVQKHQGHVQLHFFGFHPASFKRHDGVVFHPYQQNYKQFVFDFTRTGYAVGLAPMLQDPFHLSKTNAKFRDFSAAGVVGLYQDCSVYEDVVDQQTGLRISGEPGSWLNGVEWLLERPDSVRSMRVNARQYAEAHFALTGVAEHWLKNLEGVLAGAAMRKTVVSVPERWWFTQTITPITAPSGTHLTVHEAIINWTRKQYHRFVPLGNRLKFRDYRRKVLKRLYDHNNTS